LAEFCVVPRAATIQCNPQPPTPLDIIRRLLIDHVVPLTLSLNSRAAIHASSITTPRGAIGFVGMSGCGKSTLAASFVAAGHALLGDDCLALKQDHGPIVATPSGAGMWLSAEVATALSIEFGSIAPRKKRIAAPGAKLDAPVVGLFVLAASEPGTSVEMTRLSQADGLMELVRHAFRLDVTDQPMLARQFSLLSQLVQQAPVYRLKYPREFLVLPAVRRVILQSIEGELGR
jgi:energy-coupling factor transporter ATP-binding protein EcfA2